MKISNFSKTHSFGIIFTFVDDFTLNSDNNKEIWSLGLCWPLLAFIGLFGLYGLGWFFKAKNGLCWYKLSTIDLFPTIRCQNQLPNEFQPSESLCYRAQLFDKLPNFDRYYFHFRHKTTKNCVYNKSLGNQNYLCLRWVYKSIFITNDSDPHNISNSFHI
mgnify:CR=1 FL=1